MTKWIRHGVADANPMSIGPSTERDVSFPKKNWVSCVEKEGRKLGNVWALCCKVQQKWRCCARGEGAEAERCDVDCDSVAWPALKGS